MSEEYSSLERSRFKQVFIANTISRKCILWSPIHPLTWFLPFFGHIAIADSQGNVYDFQGTFNVGKNHMLFGYPTKYVQLVPPGENDAQWDEAVFKAIRQYKQEYYSIW